MDLNMNLIKNMVTKYPKMVVGITIILTLFFGYYAIQVEINTDIKDMFPKDHPTITTFEDVGDAYGGSEFVVLILEHEEHVINLETLASIDYLTNEFEEIQGVNKVRSITNIDEIRGMDFTIEVGQFIDDLPQMR